MLLNAHRKRRERAGNTHTSAPHVDNPSECIMRGAQRTSTRLIQCARVIVQCDSNNKLFIFYIYGHAFVQWKKNLPYVYAWWW